MPNKELYAGRGRSGDCGLRLMLLSYINYYFILKYHCMCMCICKIPKVMTPHPPERCDPPESNLKQLKGCMKLSPKCVFHKRIQGNLKGESVSLSEVT